MMSTFKLPHNSLQFVSEIKDQNLRTQAEELKGIMRKLASALNDPSPPKTFKDFLKIAKKTIKKMRKRQLKVYYKWRKESWANVQKYLSAKQKIYDGDDALNVFENEKFYQLFLVEDSEKREYLLPLLDLQNKVLRRVADELELLYDAEKIKQASVKAARKVMRALNRKSKRVRHRAEDEYLAGVREMHAKFMRDWKRNEKFVGFDQF